MQAAPSDRRQRRVSRRPGSAPAGSAAEGRRGSIDGRDLLPAGSAAEGRRGSIDGRTCSRPAAPPKGGAVASTAGTCSRPAAPKGGAVPSTTRSSTSARVRAAARSQITAGVALYADSEDVRWIHRMSLRRVQARCGLRRLEERVRRLSRAPREDLARPHLPHSDAELAAHREPLRMADRADQVGRGYRRELSPPPRSPPDRRRPAARRDRRCVGTS